MTLGQVVIVGFTGVEGIKSFLLRFAEQACNTDGHTSS